MRLLAFLIFFAAIRDSYLDDVMLCGDLSYLLLSNGASRLKLRFEPMLLLLLLLRLRPVADDNLTSSCFFFLDFLRWREWREFPAVVLAP